MFALLILKSVIHLTIDLKAVPKARPRFNRVSRQIYTPAKTSAFESHVSFAASCVCKRPLEGAVEVEINFNFLKAKSSKLIAHTKRPDIDNLIKSVLDGLNGVAFIDDAQIIKLIASKNFGDKDFIEITICELN